MQLFGIALGVRVTRVPGQELGRAEPSAARARPVEPFDVAPADEVPLGGAHGGQPAHPDRLPQPAGIAPDDPCRLGHAQRVAGLVEVAVVAEVAVVDRAVVDRVAGRPG